MGITFHVTAMLLLQMSSCRYKQTSSPLPLVCPHDGCADTNAKPNPHILNTDETYCRWNQAMTAGKEILLDITENLIHSTVFSTAREDTAHPINPSCPGLPGRGKRLYVRTNHPHLLLPSSSAPTAFCCQLGEHVQAKPWPRCWQHRGLSMPGSPSKEREISFTSLPTALLLISICPRRNL